MFSYIFLIGAAQGLVLALALWRKSGNHDSNRVLAVWLLMLAFDLLVKAVYINDSNTPLLPLYILIQFFPFFYGSFFYLYVRTLVKQQAIKWLDLVHFLGFLIMLSINIDWIVNPQWPDPSLAVYFEPLLYAYSISYVLVGLFLVTQYRRQSKAQLSDLTGVNLLWLMVMAYGQVVIWGVAVCEWLLPIAWLDFWYIYVVISLWIIAVGYLALRQSPVTALKPIKSTTEHTDEGRFKQVQAKLESLMNTDQLYLKPSLTIKHLAQKSGYPEYLISLLLNRVHQQSFHQYINTQRIRHAKELLSDAANKDSILDVAYASGFTAKSTFNTAFKQFVGTTPSDFRRQSAVNDAAKTAVPHK